MLSRIVQIFLVVIHEGKIKRRIYNFISKIFKIKQNYYKNKISTRKIARDPLAICSDFERIHLQLQVKNEKAVGAMGAAFAHFGQQAQP